MHQKKKHLFRISLFVALFLPAFILASTEAPETIVINTEGYKSDRKGPVLFTHQAHAEDYGTTCDACHHVYENGKNVWEEGDAVSKCRECHDPNESKGNTKKLSIAFHKNCMTCHRESGSDAAPYKKCYSCHKTN